MENLLSQLRDIRGIDAVSWWPPAPGWWMALGLLLAAAGLVLRVRRKRLAYRNSWQAAIRAEFAALRDAGEDEMKQKAAALSEVMRVLAIRRFGRAQCAGREGRAWLAWLAQHDPAGFCWDKEAVILAEAPYMPGRLVKKPENWNALIAAAEKWVKVK